MRQFTELQNGLIARFLEKYKAVKVRLPNTLFDVEPDLRITFTKHLCPFCGKPLKFLRTKPIAMCKRKSCICPEKHGFVIRVSVLKKNIKIKNY